MVNSDHPNLFQTPVEKFTSFFVFPFSFQHGATFETNSRWEPLDFPLPKRPDEIKAWKYQRNYAEFIYFHDYVREFIFPWNTHADESSGKSVRSYTYRLKPDTQVTLVYKEKPVSADDLETSVNKITAWVQGICLHIYPQNIGIVSIQIGDSPLNQQQSVNDSGRADSATALNGADVLLFNDMFRRVYPSYFENKKNGFFEQVNNKEFPWAVSVHTPDEILYEYKASEITQSTFLRANREGKLTPKLSTYVDVLLDSFFRPGGNRAYSPILDDRMLVYTYIAFPESAQKVITPKTLDIFFSRFLYVEEPQEDYRYAEEFIQCILSRNTYKGLAKY